MNSERRVQRVRAALPPLGNSRPDWQIICDVGRAMGQGRHFDFHSAEEIWNEIRRVWPAGAGISYARMETGGLQWPCPSEDHPGTAILHRETFPTGKTAPLLCIDYRPTTEVPDMEYPFVLTTGRTLYQFNAGTMSMRTPNRELRSTDTLDISPDDARNLDAREGEVVQVTSRQGSVDMPLHIDARLRPGELFATFHDPEIDLNRITGAGRDRQVMTPEYKVVAVRLEKNGKKSSAAPASLEGRS